MLLLGVACTKEKVTPSDPRDAFVGRYEARDSSRLDHPSNAMILWLHILEIRKSPTSPDSILLTQVGKDRNLTYRAAIRQDSFFYQYQEMIPSVPWPRGGTTIEGKGKIVNKSVIHYQYTRTNFFEWEPHWYDAEGKAVKME
jgi:hypothetical protein